MGSRRVQMHSERITLQRVIKWKLSLFGENSMLWRWTSRRTWIPPLCPSKALRLLRPDTEQSSFVLTMTSEINSRSYYTEGVFDSLPGLGTAHPPWAGEESTWLRNQNCCSLFPILKPNALFKQNQGPTSLQGAFWNWK